MRGLIIFVLILMGSLLVFADLDARQIIERSLAVADRSWKANHAYTYIERDEEDHLDGQGQIRSADIDISKAIIVNGDTFEQTISHNGKPPTEEKKKKEAELLRKRQNETPQERAARLKEQADDRAFIGEIPDAFDFKTIGEETINGRPAYILDALPKPGYQARSKYTKMFSKVHGKLWVDKEDFGWVRVDALVVAPFSMFVLARVQPGAHIHFEQTRVAPGIWLPAQIEVKADAKILFVKNYQIQQVITYSDYRSGTATQSLLRHPGFDIATAFSAR